MKSVLVLGGGKVGKSVAELFLGRAGGDYRVTVVDAQQAALDQVRANLDRLKAHRGGQPTEFAVQKADLSAPGAVRQALRGHDYVVCMLPYDLVAGVAEAANAEDVHYFDVTEDVATTEGVNRIQSEGRAKVALVPQCGLAPGYVAIAAYALARGFRSIEQLTLRVGALPQFPTNALKYNVTWSAAGVINEYCEPCNVMLGGQRVKVPALEGLERFSFEGVEYEAFYTSGGVGSLIDTLVSEGRLSQHADVAYKTIRYPGHRDLMKFLLQDLRLGVKGGPKAPSGRAYDRAAAIELLDLAIPATLQDCVVVFANAVGLRPDGRREQVNFRRVIRAASLWGRIWPAIELTTAAGVCAMVDLHRTAKLPATGLIRQEQCPIEAFNATPFGAAYESPDALASGA
ncbi:MAG: saccharopine dehydrogenase family protein [Phycisphaerae bacterium]|nr:saccharopine dehydrogenase family protein [Phycisphaerae bacterium]